MVGHRARSSSTGSPASRTPVGDPLAPVGVDLAREIDVPGAVGCAIGVDLMEADRHRIRGAMASTLKYLLTRVRDPDPLGQPARRPAGPPPPPPASPRHQGAARARGPGADLPHGADRAGGLGRARDRDPRGGARDLQAVAPDAALPRPAPRARARHPGAHLLQVRGRLARRLAQAEHRRRAGLLQQARGRRASSPPRPAPASGARRWRSPAGCSTSSARCSWSGSATTRSPTAGR